MNWDSEADVVLSTHIDTVPPFFPSRTDGDKLYGRGACDTKGIIASMLIAGQRLEEKGITPSYVFLVGEEYDSIGAKAAAKTGKTARYIINGEPTHNTLVKGHKGVLGYMLEARGRAAHSAFPELGQSAIDTLLDVIQDIRSEDWGTDEILGSSTLNIGLIQGGRAKNVIPDAATATLMHRVVTDPDEMRARVTELVAGRVAVNFFSRSEPQLMHVPNGREYTVVPFGTDVPYLRAMGTPLLVGPGDIHLAHTDEEHISISEMERAVDMYVELYLELLAS